MIARPKPKYKQLLDKPTITKLRSIARKGSDHELESFLRMCAMIYIADAKDADIVDAERCLVVGDEKYDCECPCCHEMIELDIKGLL